MTHDPNGPSQLKKRKLCPGSYHAELGLPSTESEFAKEGTDLHALVEDSLTKHLQGIPLLPWSELEGVSLPTLGTPMDRYQVSAVRACFHHALDAIECVPQARVLIESRLELDHLGIPLGGTSDLIVVSDEALVAVDWKFGYNPVDHAKHNLQGWAYLSGARRMFPGRKSYTMRFFQPRAPDGTSYHTFSEGEILMNDEEIRRIVRAAMAPDAPRRASRDACHYCEAKLLCPAARRSINRVLELIYDF